MDFGAPKRTPYPYSTLALTLTECANYPQLFRDGRRTHTSAPVSRPVQSSYHTQYLPT